MAGESRTAFGVLDADALELGERDADGETDTATGEADGDTGMQGGPFEAQEMFELRMTSGQHSPSDSGQEAGPQKRHEAGQHAF